MSNETKHERDVINNEQRKKSASFTNQENNVREEMLVFEEEVKNGADFWNYDTDVTI